MNLSTVFKNSITMETVQDLPFRSRGINKPKYVESHARRRLYVVGVFFILLLAGVLALFLDPNFKIYGLPYRGEITVEFIVIFIGYIFLAIILFMYPLLLVINYTQYTVHWIIDKIEKDLERAGIQKGNIEERFNEFYSKNHLSTFVFPTLILTSMLLVYWSFTLMPHGLTGASLSLTTNYTRASDPGYYTYDGSFFMDFIANNASIVTWGFLGAYFYLMTNLTFRWHQKDLTAGLLWRLCARLTIVFIVGLLFTKVWPDVPIYLVFISGIAPDMALGWLGGRGKDLLALVKPDAGGIFKQRSLEKDLDITFWQAERLSEEGISSVQDLATADIPGLMMNTRFETSTLMYWIDKALLKNQVGDDYPYFAQAYIKTASDFYDLTHSKPPIDLTNIEKSINNVIESSKEKKITKEMLDNLMQSFKAGPNMNYIIKYWSHAGCDVRTQK